MRPFIPRLPRPLAVLLLTAAAACTDRNPAAAPQSAPSPLPPGARSLLTCTVSVRQATLACAPAEAGTPAGVSAAVLGGQGQNVRLASTGVSYDGTSTFRADVTLENLTGQALGTPDGVNASGDAIRVFFSSPPVATQGAGAVEVANADGEGFFTAAAQKFFRYDGILAPGQTSAAREWRFSVPSTVENFTFGVYVAAAVRAEGGWLAMAPVAPALAIGDTVRVTAAARNLAGGAADAPAATWATSNAAVATVDAQGLVTATGAGAATVTATRGDRTGSVEVRVSAAGSAPLATVHGFEVLDGRAVAGVADSVHFRVHHGGPAGLPLYMEVVLRHASGAQHSCRANNPVNAPGVGEWRCGIAFGEGSWPGAWRVWQVTIANRTMTHAALVAAGAPAFVYVESDAPDQTPPTLVHVSLSPDTVTAGAQSVTMQAIAAHEGVPASRIEAYVSSMSNPRIRAAGAYIRTDGGSTFFHIGFTVPRFFHGGRFILDSMAVWDTNNNRARMNTTELAEAGFPSEFFVIGNSPDSVAPVITAFSFSPATVAGNGTDSVTVTLSAMEPTLQSGTWFLDMELEKVGDGTPPRRCLLNGTGQAHQRTMTCRQAFGPGDVGAWRVRYIRAIDYMNHQRVLFTEEIAAAGYPTALTVTAP